MILSEDQLIIATRCFYCRTYNLRRTMLLRWLVYLGINTANV